ncbi:MAG: CIA30 family protein [Lysobacter sp.]
MTHRTNPARPAAKLQAPSPIPVKSLLLGALLSAGAAFAADPAATAPATPAADTAAAAPELQFAIRQVRVFDGERVLPSATVLVRDGLIAEVGAKVKVPAGVPVIEGKGATVLPGLIDSHVHSWGEARSDALRFGVTTELDMFTDFHQLPAARAEREARNKTAQADLWSAGTLVTAKGGHGTEYGVPIPTLDDPAQAQAFVDARIAEGSDYIKLVLEQGRDSKGKSHTPTLSDASLRAAIAAAHERGRLAVVHVSLQEEAALAIDAGADGLAHINGESLDDPKLIEAIKRHKAFVVPTLSVLASIAGAGEGERLAADARIAPWLQAAQKDSLKVGFKSNPNSADRLKNAMDNVRRLHKAGVPLLAGTDAGNPATAHGVSEHGELDLLVRSGLTPVEALRAATSVPARSFKLADRGRIAPGLRADLLLVDGDPTTDVTATRAIRTIWKNGYPVSRKVGANAAVVKPGAVALLDQGKPGPRWMGSADNYMGGKSSSRLETGSGSEGAAALAAKGEIVAGIAQPWGGLTYMPGSVPFGAADASAVHELTFRVRGDGRSLLLLVFSGPDMKGQPAVQMIQGSAQWQAVKVPLASLPNVDLKQLRGISISAVGAPGPFAFEIEGFELR